MDCRNYWTQQGHQRSIAGLDILLDKVAEELSDGKVVLLNAKKSVDVMSAATASARNVIAAADGTAVQNAQERKVMYQLRRGRHTLWCRQTLALQRHAAKVPPSSVC